MFFALAMLSAPNGGTAEQRNTPRWLRYCFTASQSCGALARGSQLSGQADKGFRDTKAVPVLAEPGSPERAVSCVCSDLSSHVRGLTGRVSRSCSRADWLLKGSSSESLSGGG